MVNDFYVNNEDRLRKVSRIPSTFCLDAKSSKKIKAKPIAPPVSPGQRTCAVLILYEYIFLSNW